QDLVVDAHKRIGLGLERCENRYGTHHKNRFAPCMSATRDDRSANIRLSDQELFPKVEFDDFTERSRTPEFQEKTKRYFDIKPPLPNRVNDIFEFAKMINERAKKMLVLDGMHSTIFILCYSDGKYNPLGMHAENQSEKFILIQSVADYIRRTKASGVIAVSEIWAILQKEAGGNQFPEEHPNRKEALQVIAINKNKIVVLTTFFTRDKNNKINLGGTHEAEPLTFKLIEPIIKALRSV
ncbi:MAG: hypothetical protein JRJ00_03795, partial [Deltaproteobacteria bacterium]|nr:hypothetical protein [Deltaproteobacteria bacterium]